MLYNVRNQRYRVGCGYFLEITEVIHYPHMAHAQITRELSVLLVITLDLWAIINQQPLSEDPGSSSFIAKMDYVIDGFTKMKKTTTTEQMIPDLFSWGFSCVSSQTAINIQQKLFILFVLALKTEQKNSGINTASAYHNYVHL